MYNEHNSLTPRHKITSDRLACHLNHTTIFFPLQKNLVFSPCYIDFFFTVNIAQLTRTVEYADFTSAEGQDPLLPPYDIKQSDGEVPVMQKLWGMWSTPSWPSLLGPLCHGVVEPDGVLSMVQIESNCILMLNWIAWNRTVLTFKLHTYTKLNCLKWNCFWHWSCTYATLNCLK